MATPQSLGWSDQVTSEAVARANCTTIQHGGRAFVVNQHVAHLFLGFLRELTATGYDYSTGELDDWSFAFRRIRGGTSLSVHCGFAIDLDATRNVLGSTRHTFPAGIAGMARRWGLVWGGEWLSRPDPMHFEVRLTPAEVRAFKTPEGDDMYDAEAEKRIMQRIEEAERRVARYVDHGNADQQGTGNHHVKVREDIRAVQVTVETLATAVGELSRQVALLQQAGLPSGEVGVSGRLQVGPVLTT